MSQKLLSSYAKYFTPDLEGLVQFQLLCLYIMHFFYYISSNFSITVFLEIRVVHTNLVFVMTCNNTLFKRPT